MIKSILTLFNLTLLFVSLCYPDYRSEEQIAPGVVYFHDYRSSGPWHLHVLEIDLSNPWVELESVKAANSLFAREKTSAMSAKMNKDNHYITSAINADFFEWDGLPVGGQVINGLLINEPTTRSVFGVTVDNKPFIDVVDYRGQLFINKMIALQINGLNRIKRANELILYNSYYNADTVSYGGGTIIRAKLCSDEFALNDTMEFQISRIFKSDDLVLNTNDIRENEIMLISPDDNFSDLGLGDRIQILLNLSPITNSVDQLIGGLPRLIRDGELSIDWKEEKIRETFSTKRHPRTGVGYSKDKQKVYFFVVDGRQPDVSVGMTLSELAIYMLEWDVYQGVNLDGGGSTTMVVHGEVVNNPSDPTGERPVTNALMVVNTALESDTVQINVSPDHVELSLGTRYQFEVNEQDINFHPSSNMLHSVKWFCDSNLGVIDSTGLFTVADYTGTGYIVVEIDGQRDSSQVSIVNNKN